MTKQELVITIARQAGLTRSQASRALEACVAGIQAGLVRGDRVTISGFGTFGVAHRKARRVGNPKSGGSLEIAARNVARFAPGLLLKSAIGQAAAPSIKHR